MKLWMAAAILAATFIVIALAIALSMPNVFISECVGVIRLQGDIYYGSADDAGKGVGVFFFTGTSSGELAALLQQGSGDWRVKSILLVVNSPGGSAVASKEVFDAVRATTAKKPVVAYLSELATSGAYYAASPANWIVANPNAITGSIGAQATFINYEEFLRKIGLREESIQTGEMKDIGAGYRNMTDEERRLLGELINETFKNFKNDVVSARGKKVENSFFQQALDARILSAKMALRAGLVDEIGGERNALRKAAELGGISFEDEPPVCMLRQPFSFLDVFSQIGASIARGFVSQIRAQERIALEYR